MTPPPNPITTGANSTSKRTKQAKLAAKKCKQRKGWENEWKQITIGFGFTSSWLKKSGATFSTNPAERSEVKPKQMRLSSDTQLKNTLLVIAAIRHVIILPYTPQRKIILSCRILVQSLKRCVRRPRKRPCRSAQWKFTLTSQF